MARFYRFIGCILISIFVVIGVHCAHSLVVKCGRLSSYLNVRQEEAIWSKVNQHSGNYNFLASRDNCGF